MRYKLYTEAKIFAKEFGDHPIVTKHTDSFDSLEEAKEVMDGIIKQIHDFLGSGTFPIDAGVFVLTIDNTTITLDEVDNQHYNINGTYQGSANGGSFDMAVEYSGMIRAA